MAAASSTSSSAGIGLGGALFLVFLVLKLTRVIDWSWWWVTAPLWGSVALFIGVLLVVVVVVFVRAWVQDFLASRRRRARLR